jgi:hypothetical protein
MATINTKPNTIVKGATEEKWRNSSLYTEIMVSSYGRIKEREYQKVVKDKDGGFRIYAIPAKIIQPFINTASGNLEVSFYANGMWTNECVDFLVAKEFVQNEDPTHYTRIKHIDGDKMNVKASNLMWNGHGVFAK